MARVFATITTSIGISLACAYPVLVYLGISRLSIRALGLVLLVALLPLVLLRLRGRRREHLRAVLPLPLGIAALLLLAVWIEDRRFVLLLPVLINLALLGGFAATLRSGAVPMIERFARMQVDDLSRAEVVYCRRVTVLWVSFFGFNVVLISALALLAPLAWWTLYSGFVVYLLMGLLFAGEYLVRKVRFRRSSGRWHDRVIERFIPLRSERRP